MESEGALLPPTDEGPHHPHAPALQEIELNISKEMMYEYECPTHTAKELRELSNHISRTEFRSLNDWAVSDNIISRQIDEHNERYTRSISSAVERSKL